METSALGILVLLLLFQVKHAIFDGPLQMVWMVAEKGSYGQRGGLVHAALHGVGTLAALLVFGVGGMLALLLAAIDTVLHYHIDFTKETIVRRNGWTTGQSYFWWAYAADQFAHQVIYLGLAAAVVLQA